MTFRFHLIFVGAIVFLVFIAAQIFGSKPKAVEPEVILSPYTISIVRASWGMECNQPTMPPVVNENNVKDRVASLCNGKTECSVAVDIDVLGKDPAPKCPNKQLIIEYRCFTYDRLQTVQASSGSVRVKCDQNIEQPKQ